MPFFGGWFPSLISLHICACCKPSMWMTMAIELSYITCQPKVCRQIPLLGECDRP
jgi:hypothetical protein